MLSIINQLFLLLKKLDKYFEKYPRLKKNKKLLIMTPVANAILLLKFNEIVPINIIVSK